MGTCHTRVSWKGVSEGAGLSRAVELPSHSKFAANHKASNPHLLSACVHFPLIPVPSPPLSYHKRRLVLIGRGNCQCSCVYYYLLLTRFVTCHRIFDTKSDISVSFGAQMR